MTEQDFYIVKKNRHYLTGIMHAAKSVVYHSSYLKEAKFIEDKETAKEMAEEANRSECEYLKTIRGRFKIVKCKITEGYRK